MQLDLAFWKHMVEAIPLATWAVDASDIVVVFNAEMEKIMGISSDQACGQKLADVIPHFVWGDQIRFQDFYQVAKETGEVMEIEVQRSGTHNGRTTTFRSKIRPFLDLEGEFAGLIGTIENITARVTSDEQLKAFAEELEHRVEERTAQLGQMNQFLDSIIENIPLSIIVKDAFTGRYERVNQVYEQQKEQSRADVLGKTTMDLYPPAHAQDLLQFDQQVIRDKQIVEFEYTSSTTGKLFRAKKIPLLNGEGNVEKILVIAEEVTQQRKIEQERQHLLEETLQVSELKSNIITMAAHELKTPLTSIYGWTELMYAAKKQGRNLDETFDLEDFETILRNADRLNSLINDLLDVEHIESGQLELIRQRVDFREVLHNAIQTVEYQATQRGVMFLTDLEPDDYIFIDRRRMEQVMINLLSNAIKYSPENSRVTIQTSKFEDGERPIFRIQVIDEGYGFTPEELAEATQPFGKAYTRQDQKRVVKGTGLGLFISRRLVEQHNGTLTVYSEGANLGASIEIILPLDED